VTERQTAETRFRELLESAPDAVVLVGAEGQISLVNRRTEELFGYEPGELIDREVELLVPDRFRAGHLAYRAGYAADPRTREMGAGLELYGRRRDGSEFPVEISLSPMRADGDQLVIAIVRDVSQRRAAERERLALALEQAALRRVATLVARGVPPEELFAAVTEEVGRLLHVDHAHLGRYESDGTVTIVADSSSAGDPFPVGVRWSLIGENLSSLVAQTGRPARIDSYPDASGPLAAATAERGIRSGVGAPIVVEGRLWGVMVAGSILEQQLPPDTEARLGAFTELVATAIANAESRAELTASRARIVAAADKTRRQIERDLHDGAQQQLVSLVLQLRAAHAAVPAELVELKSELDRVAEGLASFLEGLQEISRGIHPAILAKGGLGPALKTLARRSPIPVKLELRAEAPLPERVEIAAYYVVSETLTNAAKHAHASLINVEMQTADGALHLRIRDNGDGGADATRGSGLIGLKDRVETLGGTINVQSPTGAGTTVHVELPLSD